MKISRGSHDRRQVTHWLGALALLAGCIGAPSQGKGEGGECSTDDDCGGDLVCAAGVCSAGSAPDSGGRDASTFDAADATSDPPDSRIAPDSGTIRCGTGCPVGFTCDQARDACVCNDDTACAPGVCVTGQCVECRSAADCGEDLYCVANACVACRSERDCDTESASFCNAGTCEPCQTSEQCAHLGDAPLCVSGVCGACATNADCADASASFCDPTTLTCEPCSTNADCGHLSGTGICDAGECVECLDDDETTRAACVVNGVGRSCDPTTRTCTDTEVESVGLCNSCVTQSECRVGLGCIETTFRDSNDQVTPVGSYCLREQSPDGSCGRVFQPTQETPVGRDVDGGYCTLPPGLTTCEVFQRFGRNCNDDTSCTDDSGLGNPVCGGNSRCTYACATSDQCPNTFTCSDALTPNRCIP